MKLLIVEDEKKTGEYLTKGLTEAGFVVDLADNGLNGYHLAMTGDYDLIILDIMLPDGSGLDALQFVKSRYPEVACIILSALSKEEDKVNGLNLGADDYVSKPFSVLELTARVNARLREKQKPALMAAGNVTLNTETFSCTVGGEAVALNRKEYELLRVLMENKGKVLSRDRLLTDVWGYDSGETRTLDNHVARLRKLGIKIETVFGVGYKLAAD